MAAIFLFSLVSMEPVTDIKIASEIRNQLLPNLLLKQMSTRKKLPENCRSSKHIFIHSYNFVMHDKLCDFKFYLDYYFSLNIVMQVN